MKPSVPTKIKPFVQTKKSREVSGNCSLVYCTVNQPSESHLPPFYHHTFFLALLFNFFYHIKWMSIYFLNNFEIQIIFILLLLLQNLKKESIKYYLFCNFLMDAWSTFINKTIYFLCCYVLALNPQIFYLISKKLFIVILYRN